MILLHIRRTDGTSLFLDQLYSDEQIIKRLPESSLHGFYGKEPPMEAVVDYRESLYQKIDAAVKRHIRERLFIPRFLIASAVFLLSFFFMSLVILTPVPIVDELIISLLAAVAVYIIVGRRQNGSEQANRQRIALRAVIDGVRFTESVCVCWLEKQLHMLEALSAEKLIQTLVGNIEHEPPPGDCNELLAAATESLRHRLPQFEDVRQQLDSVLVPSQGGVEVIHQSMKSRNMDIPLYALLHIMQSHLTVT